jgi:hypothetical protein
MAVIFQLGEDRRDIGAAGCVPQRVGGQHRHAGPVVDQAIEDKRRPGRAGHDQGQGPGDDQGGYFVLPQAPQRQPGEREGQQQQGAMRQRGNDRERTQIEDDRVAAGLTVGGQYRIAAGSGVGIDERHPVLAIRRDDGEERFQHVVAAGAIANANRPAAGGNRDRRTEGAGRRTAVLARHPGDHGRIHPGVDRGGNDVIDAGEGAAGRVYGAAGGGVVILVDQDVERRRMERRPEQQSRAEQAPQDQPLDVDCSHRFPPTGVAPVLFSARNASRSRF